MLFVEDLNCIFWAFVEISLKYAHFNTNCGFSNESYNFIQTVLTLNH